MRIPAGSSYSEALCLIGYESLTLMAATETLNCNISVSYDGSVWQAFTALPQALILREAWQAPAAIFDYKYLRLQTVAVDYDRVVTATLTNLETGGIPVGSGVGQFMYATATGVGLTPVPGGAGVEIPCMRDGTPALFLSNVAANDLPAVGDDINDGYNVGSFWYDMTSGRIFICANPAAGAAVWTRLLTQPTITGSGFEIPGFIDNVYGVVKHMVASVAPTITDDVTAGYHAGSFWYDAVGANLYLCVLATAGSAVWRKLPVYQADGTLRLGGAANYVNIATDGTLTLVGDARTFDDEIVDAYNLKTTGPGVSLDPAEGVIEFVHTAQVTDYCSSNTQFRHNRALLEHVDPHIHFFQAEAAVPNFMMYYRWQLNGGAKVTAWTPYKCNTPIHTYVNGTLHQIVEGAGITPPQGTSLSDILQLRICRDHDNASTLFAGEDPYTATVGVLSIDIHRVIDSLGSAQEYIK